MRAPIFYATYNYYRTYDPATGRYLESDPIGLAAGPNTYAYVSNMPTMLTDKYGLVEWDVSMTGGMAAYGPGAGAFAMILTSKGCWNGQRATVKVAARGSGAGVGAKWTLPFTGWEDSRFVMSDRYDYINLQNMNGVFAMTNASFGIGVAGYAQTIGFGDASHIDGGVTGANIGFREGTVEAGVFSILGSANVIDANVTECGCSE